MCWEILEAQAKHMPVSGLLHPVYFLGQQWEVVQFVDTGDAARDASLLVSEGTLRMLCFAMPTKER